MAGEVMEYKAGREFDIIIARDVMGMGRLYLDLNSDWVPHYSTNFNDTQGMIKYLTVHEGVKFEGDWSDNVWHITCRKQDDDVIRSSSASGDELTFVCCLAALRMVNYD